MPGELKPADMRPELTPFYRVPDATLYVGDVVETLRELPDQSVQCCVTSPPYWGLRDYRADPSVWGGDPGGAHAGGVVAAEEHPVILVEAP